MGLFNRSASVRVTVTPDVVRPRQAVTATVTTDTADRQGHDQRGSSGATTTSTATTGPGARDSAAAAANDTLWMAGEVGTNYGGERDTDDWVA